MALINKKFPLIIEQHPENYNGYPFITLIVYDNDRFISIIDNHDKNEIKAYILDYCKINNIDEESIIKIAIDWYKHKSYPISIEFAKHGLDTTSIYRSFNINYIKRIIGPLVKFDMEIKKKVKRKKRKLSDSNIQISYKPISFDSI